MPDHFKQPIKTEEIDFIDKRPPELTIALYI
jgi:hypothetical protein